MGDRCVCMGVGVNVNAGVCTDVGVGECTGEE